MFFPDALRELPRGISQPPFNDSEPKGLKEIPPPGAAQFQETPGQKIKPPA